MEAWLEKGWRVDLNSKGRTEREGGRREYVTEDRAKRDGGERRGALSRLQPGDLPPTGERNAERGSGRVE